MQSPISLAPPILALSMLFASCAMAQAPDPRPAPNIVGLRLGMSPDEARAALQHQYPKAGIQTHVYTLVPYLPANQKALNAFSIGYADMTPVQERISVYFTPPPNEPVVWRIRRELLRQRIFRTNAFDGLREKYGKEDAAFYGGTVARDDSMTNQIWWIIDANGHRAALPNSNQLNQTLSECAKNVTSESVDPNATPFAQDRIVDYNQGLGLKLFQEGGWCNSAGIFVKADIGQQDDIVFSLTVEMLDIPAATRAARAEADMFKGIANGNRQRQIDAAKQAKPTL